MNFASLLNSKEISPFESSHSEMSLEPRLQEYIEKKKYYRDNDVEPCVPLEKEYQITSLDLQIIRAYLKGDTQIYEKVAKMHSSNSSNSNYNKERFEFPSKELLKDKRVPKMKKELNKDTPINRGMFVPEKHSRHYEDMTETSNNNQLLYSRDLHNNDGRGFDLNETKFSPRADPRIDPGIETHSKYSSQYRVPKSDKLEPNPNPRKVAPAFNEKKNPNFNDNSYLGYSSVPKNSDNKRIPERNTKYKSDLDYSDYRLLNFQNNPFMMDSCTENELVRGMSNYRTHNRSYGYRNPEENYFDYVDPEFNDPNKTVEPWTRGGDATRLENKTIAKNNVYRRDIM